MARFESVAIPFVTIGNRRALTSLQMMQEPWLADFVKCFPHCFEHYPCYDALLYIEPEYSGATTGASISIKQPSG